MMLVQIHVLQRCVWTSYLCLCAVMTPEVTTGGVVKRSADTLLTDVVLRGQFGFGSCCLEATDAYDACDDFGDDLAGNAHYCC
jgi:hypothetical protein